MRTKEQNREYQKRYYAERTQELNQKNAKLVAFQIVNALQRIDDYERQVACVTKIVADTCKVRGDKV